MHRCLRRHERYDVPRMIRVISNITEVVCAAQRQVPAAAGLLARHSPCSHRQDRKGFRCGGWWYVYVYVSSGNQTWLAGKSPQMEVSMGKSAINGGFSIAKFD